MCINNKEKYIDREYVGFVFDKIKRNDGLFQYMVYIAELKMVKRFTTRYDIENSTFNTCKLYIFNDEERFKHKIMVEIIKLIKFEFIFTSLDVCIIQFFVHNFTLYLLISSICLFPVFNMLESLMLFIMNSSVRSMFSCANIDLKFSST